MAPDLSSSYRWVLPAFLELVAPSLSDSIESAIAQGASSISVYPYFLNSGNHVERDVPEIVDRFAREYPDLEFIVFKHFGSSPDVPSLILDQIRGS